MQRPSRPGAGNPRAVFVLLAGAMVLGAASQALFGLAVARWLSTEHAGAYFIGLAITTLVGYAGRIGTEQLALRDASPAWGNDDPSTYGAVARMLRRTVVRGSVITVVAMLVALSMINIVLAPEVLGSSLEIWLAVVLMLPMNLLATGCALLRAADRMVTSVAFRYLWVFAPALALVAITNVTGSTSASPTLAVLVCTTIVAARVWWQIAILSAAGDHDIAFASVRPAAVRLTVSTALNAALTWSDRLILGAVLGAAAVGIYGAAWQLILPFNLIFLLGGTISSPVFSRLHARGDLAQLEATARTLSLAMFIAAAVAGTVIVFASPHVLAFLGDDYEGATLVVAILIVGQVINLGAGPIGNLYAMANQEALLLRVTAASAGLSIAATIGLTLVLGATGTALAVTIGLAAKNVSLVVFAREHLGIAPVVVMPRLHTPVATGPLAGLFG